MIKKRAILAVLFFTTALTAPAIARQSEWGSGISLKEIGESNTYPINTNTGAIPVDARSRIELRFDSETLAQPDNAAAWKELNNVLDEIKELSTQRTTIVKELISAKSQGNVQVKETRRLAAAYTRKYAEFIDRVHKIIGESSYKELDNRARNEGRGFLEVLASSLSVQLAGMIPTSASTPKRSTASIEVMALLEAAGQDRKPLHVDNYDLLPEGILSPLPKTGLEMSQEEQGKLNQELAYAKQAVSAIQEVRNEKNHLVQQALAFKTQLREQLAQNLSTSNKGLEAFRTQLEQLRPIAADTKGTSTFLPAVSSATATLDSISGTISSLRKEIDSLEAAGPNLLLMGEQTSAIVKHLSTFSRQLTQLQPQVVAATKEIKGAIGAAAIERREELTERVKLLEESIQTDTLRFLSRAAETLPATVQLANSWQTIWKGAAEQTNASDALGDPHVPTIPHGLDDLPPATLDLSRSGVKVGDYVTVKVKLTTQENGGLGRSQEKNYRFRVGSMGLHREFTGQLLFAAPSAGPNKGLFEANVGVLATWKYGFRDPQTPTYKFLDWLNPGIGIHTTSLHQGSSTMEVGVGGAISLWDNLLTGGYGWNLGVNRNRGYYFVGIGILDLLHKMNKTTLGK